MAKKRYGHLTKVRVNSILGMGALAALDALTAGIGGTLEEDCRVMSAHLTWSWETPTSGEGPILAGLNHPDYTSAEVEEAIEATVTSSSSMIEREQSNRLVRDVVTLASSQQNANDGLPIKTRLNWQVRAGDSILNSFVYNLSSTGLTTGSVLRVVGHLWVKFG